tara:strand:+ start:233 stop:1636 length:1404 start_codon:yes stop_codon:yes gene_type:complete
MTDFVTAGRNVNLWLGVASMAGTEMGLITIMYSAQKGFTGGFAAFHIALVAGIVTFFIGLTGFIVVPLRKLNILTIPEFYEKRFGKDVRVLGGIMLAIGGILNMGLFLKVGAMFIVGVSGLSATILPWVMTILLIIILIYTCFGGMWSVIITDFTQFTILSLGLLTVVGLSITTIGWDTIFDTILTHKGIAGFDPLSADGEFGVSYILWMIFTAGLVSCAIWPTAVARALAMKSEKLVKQQYMITSVTFMIRFLIPYFLGICAFVYFSIQQPTLFAELSTNSTNTLYALPYYFKSILPIGILGLLIAAMIAAFMSTHDGYLLCWSSVITQDIIAPLTKKPLTQPQRLRITRICIVLIGIYIWYWGLFYSGPDDIWDYMAITGAIYFTGAFALLVTGLYWQKASRIGALSALLCGFTAILGLGPIREWLNLSFLTGAQIGLFTIALTLSVMVIGSLLYPDSQQTVATP